MNKYDTKIIQLIAAPGVGKSTTAAGVFYYLKLAGFDVEIASEYAKELTWHDRQSCMECQPYLFGKQLYRVEKLLGKVEFIITDSPLILSAFYAADKYPPSFKQFIVDTYKSLPNMNFLLERTKPYNPNGRNQTLEESEEIQRKIIDILDTNSIVYERVKANKDGVQHIVNKVESKI